MVEPRLIYAPKLWGIYRSAEGCMQVCPACMQPEGRFYTVRKGSAIVEI